MVTLGVEASPQNGGDPSTLPLAIVSIEYQRCEMDRNGVGIRVPVVVLLLGLTACGDAVIVEGVDVEKGTWVGGEAAEVQDLGDGTTNEGGAPDLEADLHEAAETEEENLGPNAPGYIP